MKRLKGLYKEFSTLSNFEDAYRKALKGKRYKKQEFVEEYEPKLKENLLKIINSIDTGKYNAGPYTIFTISRPKIRKICVAPFRDRIVHHALINVFEQRFEKYMISQTFACRKGMGIDYALKRAKEYCRKSEWYMKLDVTKYFDNIDHEILINILDRLYKDDKIRKLIINILDSYHSSVNGKGMPIGNLTSQFFANIYLTPFDHFIKEELNIKYYCRYMDDFIIFGNSKEELHKYLSKIEDYMYNNLKVTLHTPVINKIRNGVPFLGFRIFKDRIKILQKTKKNFIYRLKLNSYDLDTNKIDAFEYKNRMFSIFGHMLRANCFNYLNNICHRFDFYSKEFFNYIFYTHNGKYNLKLNKNN